MQALYFDHENGPAQLRRFAQKLKITDEILFLDLGDVSFADADAVKFYAAEVNQRKRNLLHPALKFAFGLAIEYPAPLIVIDSLSAFRPGVSEIDERVKDYIIGLRGFARETNAAVVLIHHTPKDRQGFSGRSDIINQVDMAFALKVKEEARGDVLELTVDRHKYRLGEKPAPKFWLRPKGPLEYIEVDAPKEAKLDIIDAINALSDPEDGWSKAHIIAVIPELGELGSETFVKRMREAGWELDGRRWRRWLF